MSFAKRIRNIFLGSVFIAVGLLWFLQGTNLIDIKPMVCLDPCTTSTELSLNWTILGAILLGLGCGFLASGAVPIQDRATGPTESTHADSIAEFSAEYSTHDFPPSSPK